MQALAAFRFGNQGAEFLGTAPQEAGEDRQLGMFIAQLPGRHLQQADLPPMGIEQH